MKVAIVEPVGGHGGMDYYDFGLARGLMRAGVEARVYTCDEVSLDTPAAVEVVRSFQGIWGDAPRLVRAWRFERGLRRALNDAQRWGAQVVHFHFFHTGLLEYRMVAAARRRGLRVVLTLHDVESFVRGLNIVGRRTYEATDGIIVHNRFSRESLMSRANGLRIPVAEVPHGGYAEYLAGATREDARRTLGIAPARPAVLFFGQIKQVKGLDLLIRAMPHVRVHGERPLLLIAGKAWKTDWADYVALIRSEGLDEDVRPDIRYIPPGIAELYYRAADVAVLPYRRIYQSGVLLMALSHGTPVLVSNLPPMLEIIIDGETGYVFRDGDVRDLAARLSAILDDRARTEAVGRRGEQYVREHHDWMKIGQLTACQYAAALGPSSS